MNMTDPEPTTQTPSNRNELEKPTTAVLSAKSRWRRPLAEGSPNATSSLGSDQREVIMVIRGMVERIFLSERLSVVIGRTDLGARSRPDIDLTPYGALDRGVSRAHARLHLEDNKLYITDLGSTNGTFLAGKRLTPNQPEAIRKGDELLLGRLAVQVLFR